MNNRYILFLILGLDALFLFIKIDELSISYHEAMLFYGDFSVLQAIIKTSVYFFTQNDFALRLPMLFFHILSTLLLYKISKKYLKVQRNRIWLILIYILLPGIISSSIIVNEAGLVIFGLLFFIYIYENYSKKALYFLLIAYLFISGGFVYLFLSLSIFALYHKDNKFFIFNLFLFLTSLFLFGINTHGTPSGHFLDTLGLYGAIFNPIVFIYIFYVLYRKFLSKDMNILWFISTTALVFSLLLSFRQRLNIEDFAPYLMLTLPLVAQTFEHSYRVRLSEFRKKYKLIFVISLILLLVNSSVVFFNKYLYYVVQNPHKHFSYDMHVAKELALKLKKRNINCVTANPKMSQRLKFYGIAKCNKAILMEGIFNIDKKNSVTISYKDKIVYSAYVTKLNIN